MNFKPGEQIFVEVHRKVIQIMTVDPGYEVHYLYNTGEVWALKWKWNRDTEKSERVWEKVETP